MVTVGEPEAEPIPQPVTERSADAPNLLQYPPVTIEAKNADQHPDAPRPELLEMQRSWRVGDILLGGIEAILKSADEMLPPLGSDEEPTERASRVRKAVNTPFYADTLDRLVARPFGRPVTFRGTDDSRLPEGLRHLERNADGAGKSLTAVLRAHLLEAIHRGGHCLMVDLPTTELPRSAADTLNRRPVIKSISMRDILGWTFQADPDTGDIVTTGLRLWEVNKRKNGTWGETEVKGVRIIKASSAEDAQDGYSVLYERQDNGDWRRVEANPFGATSLLLHATWTNQTGPTSGRSPMTHLAELNRAYIMGDCEQQYGASFARISTLWTVGLDKAEEKGRLGSNVDATSVRQDPPKRVTRGNRRHIRLPIEASIGLLESSGSGLAAGRAELENLRERAQQFGAAHISSQNVTATAVRSDDDRDTSNLRSWVSEVEKTADKVLRDCAALAGVELDDKFATAIFRDWSMAIEREQAMPHLFSAFDRKIVPARVVHDGLRRFGALSDLDASDELLKEAQEEADERGMHEAELALENALSSAGGDAPADPNANPADPNGQRGPAMPSGQTGTGQTGQVGAGGPTGSTAS